MARPARFRFSERVQPVIAGEREPAVYGYAWRHPSPTASLVMLHGLQSHSQWFAGAADALVDRGISVYALDRRGSGSSPCTTGDIDRYREWFDEVDGIVEVARREHPDAPVHLLGHCFGANVALGYALCRPDKVASLVMLGPGLHVKPDYSPREKLQILAAGLLAPSRRFRVPQDDELFCRDPEVLEFIGADTLGAKELTARCLLEISRMLVWLRRHLGELSVPLLVVEGTRDRIADNERNAALFTGRLGRRWQRISFDAEHFLLAEPCRDWLLEELVAWMATAAQPRPGPRPRTRTIFVSGVEVITAELPFRFSFGHALAERRSSTNVYVKLTFSDGTTGFGEGVPRPYVTGETVEAATSMLCESYVPALLGCELAAPQDVPALLDRIAGNRGSAPGAAWCALELALLDAAGGLFDLPVSHWLGPVRAPLLQYDAVIPFSSARALPALALLVRMLGIPRVKVKVGRDLDDDLNRLRVLRRVLGPDADLRVDANCAWTAEEALLAIERMRPYRISVVEQPVPAGDLDGLCRITAECPEIIAVDESLRTVEEARALVAAKAANAFNIRVSKCGGLLASMRIAGVAADAGLTCIVGAQVGESGILSAAGRHLAACVAPTYLEGSAGRLLLIEDLIDERILPGRGGRAPLHQGPGLGVTIREDVLSHHQHLGRAFHASEPKRSERRPA